MILAASSFDQLAARLKDVATTIKGNNSVRAAYPVLAETVATARSQSPTSGSASRQAQAGVRLLDTLLAHVADTFVGDIPWHQSRVELPASAKHLQWIRDQILAAATAFDSVD